MDLLQQLTTALADRYDIERELGRGGMATVYLARDTRHDRLVAVKVLDPDLAASVGGERFLAEIRVTAQLHHPNILALFDSGETSGLLYYVMPYIAGETLGARLARERQLPVSDAVRITIAVAGALEHAHKLGVIHRDLKPENILFHDGEPVVADFGIALAIRRAGGDRLTASGVSLGTPQYMSPEQATGDKVIDTRADIFSLGCVLYEMLAGETPFAAPTAQGTIARILTDRPRDLLSLRASVPGHVSAAIERALEKIPADRWTTAHDFAEALTGAHTTTAVVRPPAAHHGTPIPWIITALAVAVAVAAWLTRPKAPTEAVTLRFPIVANDSERSLAAITPGIPFSIAADDRRIAYVGPAPQGRLRIYVRALDALQTRALAGTEGQPIQPTFSPDGRWIAFILDGRLTTIPADGGPLTTILPLNGGSQAGLSWVANDTIVASVGGRLIAVPSVGGAPVVLSTPDTLHGEVAQWGPRVVGDGRIVYISLTREGMSANRIAVLSRKTGRATITGYRGTTVLGVIGDRVLWVMTNGVIMAAPIDAAGVIGVPAPVLDGVLVRPGGAAKAVLSARGSLLYERGEAETELMVVDARGSATRFGVEPRAYSHPRWSPDGTRLAVVAAKSGGSNVWIVDASLKTLTPLTSGGLNDEPEWSGDGSRVVYRSVQSAGTTLAWRRSDGTDAPSQLLTTAFDAYEGILTRSGKTLVYGTGDAAEHRRSIFSMSMDGDRTPRPIAATRFMEVAPRLSADEHWIAYVSEESGAYDVYVRPFPGPGPRYRVSTGGGTEPIWSTDGRTIFYRSARKVLAASVVTTPSFTVTARSTLFDGPYLSDLLHADYDVMPDGKHFLMVQPAENQAETVMVYGWANELRKTWRAK